MTKLATICYIDNGKDFLLLRNKKPNVSMRANTLALVANSKQQNSRKECAVREIFEETGLQATRWNESSPFRIHRARLVYVCVSCDEFFRRAVD